MEKNIATIPKGSLFNPSALLYRLMIVLHPLRFHFGLYTSLIIQSLIKNYLQIVLLQYLGGDETRSKVMQS